LALISLKCPNCGESIELDDKREFGFCMYCGNKWIKQESVKQRMEIDNSRLFDNWISLGLSALDMLNYRSAEEYANKILEQDTENGIGWFLKACAAMKERERIVEAHNCFEIAAEKMSVEEKKANGSIFAIELSGSLTLEFPERSCSDIKFNNEALLRKIDNEYKLCQVYFNNLDEKDELDILSELYDFSHDAEWTQCWEALSLIQYYLEWQAIIFPWPNERKLLELMIRTNSTMKSRKKELPPYRVSTIDDDVFLVVHSFAGEYMISNKNRAAGIKKLDGPLSESENDELARRFDSEDFEQKSNLVWEELQVAQGKVIGKSGAIKKAVDNLQSVWDYILRPLT